MTKVFSTNPDPFNAGAPALTLGSVVLEEVSVIMLFVPLIHNSAKLSPVLKIKTNHPLYMSRVRVRLMRHK